MSSKQTTSTPLNIAEQIFEDNPDSASRIIHDIPYPDKLGDKDFVRWCLIAGKAADTLNTAQFRMVYHTKMNDTDFFINIVFCF